MTEIVAAHLERVAKRGRFKVGQVVCVYAEATHYYEQIVFADWCGRAFVYLTSGGHTSILYNMRPLTRKEWR